MRWPQPSLPGLERAAVLGLDDVRPLETGERRTFRAMEDSISLYWAQGRGGPVLEIATVGPEGLRVANAELDAWVRGVADGEGVKEVWTGLWEFADNDALVQVLSSMTADGATCCRCAWSDPSPALVESVWTRFVQDPDGACFQLAHWNAWRFAVRRDDRGISTFMTTNPTSGPIEGWETFVASLPGDLQRHQHGPNRETHVLFSPSHPDFPKCLPVVLAATDKPPSNLSVEAD